jgi:hypothetical protein
VVKRKVSLCGSVDTAPVENVGGLCTCYATLASHHSSLPLRRTCPHGFIRTYIMLMIFCPVSKTGTTAPVSYIWGVCVSNCVCACVCFPCSCLVLWSKVDHTLRIKIVISVSPPPWNWNVVKIRLWDWVVYEMRISDSLPIYSFTCNEWTQLHYWLTHDNRVSLINTFSWSTTSVFELVSRTWIKWDQR